MNEIQTLTDIGLSEKEARIYLCLLETGAVSTETIAHKTKIKRPTVYFVLGQLVERALVLRVARKRKQLFEARSPNDLLSMERGRLRRLSDLVPTLLARAASHGGGDTRTLLFEGVQGIREAYFYRIDELHKKEIVGLYGTAEDMSEDVTRISLEWNEYNALHGTHTRALVPEHSSLKEWRSRDAAHKRTVRVVSYDEYTSDVSMEITPLFVRITMWESETSLVIESTKITLVWRQLFEMLWRSAEKR